MNQFASTLILATVTAILSTGVVSAQPLDLDRIEDVADSVAHSQITAGVPSTVVAVAKDGEIVFSRGYGTADLEMDVAAGPETVYNIGSIPKQFAAAVVMRLIESGQLSLDDPINDFLPEYPAQGHPVTVRHLLNHTSGIQDFERRHPSSPQWYRLDHTFEEMMALWANRSFDFEPGERYDYNNMGYYLLGEIVSRVTGLGYAEYVESELFQPLGLSHTVFCDERRIIPNRAEGYVYNDGEFSNVQYVNIRTAGAAGGYCSVVGDLIRWTHLLHGGRVVSTESLQQMTTPTVLSSGETAGYGYGLYLDEFGDHRKVYHGGSANGFGSYLAHYPEDGLSIAVLNNTAGGRNRAADMEKALARTALGVQQVDLPLTAEEIARYEGTYLLRSGARSAELQVFGEGGRLHGQIGQGSATRLLYQGDHAFIPAVSDEVRYVFVVENGRAERVSQHLSRGGVIQGDRMRER